MQRLTLTLIALAAVAGGGCGAAPSAGPSDLPSELTFADAPFQTLRSSKGGLRVDVRWFPAVPVKGPDAAELTFFDDLGNPVEGLSVDVLPWMPAHGHGTSVQPTAASTAPGVVVATPVYFYMSGQWQLRITITGADSGAGPLDDTAVATVQIP